MSDEYLSLYEYLGRKSNHGRSIYRYSQKQKIKTGYRDLPADCRTSDFEGVVTYPRAFLDEYFKNNPVEDLSRIIRLNSPEIIELKRLCKRIEALENEIYKSKQKMKEEEELPF